MNVRANLFPFMLLEGVQWSPLHNQQMVLVVSLDALAAYKSYLVKTEYIIYKYLCVAGHLSAFLSTRSTCASC